MKKSISLFITIIIYVGTNAQTGNVGIGTNSPAVRLHVTDSSVLFSAAGTLPASPGGPPAITSPGRRMLWYPSKAAFRAEYSGGTPGFNVNDIGDYSFASGKDNRVTGERGVAFGGLNTVTGIGSIAMGQANNITGVQSTTFGSSNVIASNWSFATGSGNDVSGDNSFAGGLSSSATGERSFAYGLYTISRGAQTVALGLQTITSYTNGSFVCGANNDTNNATGSTRIFELGNGASNLSRSNAITVLMNGNTGISALVPQVKLDVKGDFACRENEITLSNGLNSNINPGNFSFVRIVGPVVNFAIDGILGGTDGKILTIYNQTGTNMLIIDQTASVSAPTTRINTLEAGAPLSTTGNGSVTLQYSAADNKWMVIAMKL